MRQNSRGAGTVGPHRHTYLNPKARPSTNISPTKLNNTTIQQSCRSFQAPSPSVVLFYVAEYSHIITFLPLALFSIPIPLSYELATAFMRTHIPYFPSLSRPQTSQTLGRPQTYPLAPFRTQPALPLPLLSIVQRHPSLRPPSPEHSIHNHPSEAAEQSCPASSPPPPASCTRFTSCTLLSTKNINYYFCQLHRQPSTLPKHQSCNTQHTLLSSSPLPSLYLTKT